jgi:Flp pilus assembly pilin Flp
MRFEIRETLLLIQVAILETFATTRRRVGDAMRRPWADERGQTPTEYLMIVGLMAVVIVTVFVFYYWSNVKQVAQDWVVNVQESLSGKKIDQ